MTRGQRFLTYAAATLGVVVLGWVVLIAGIYLYGGVATVSVVEHHEGVRLHLPIPMALIHAAAATSHVFFLDELIDEIEIETGGRFGEWAPAVLEIVEALGDVPNGTTLVSVDDGRERVRVAKERGKFRIEVDAEDVSVRVSVPVRSVERLVAELVR
jgi:hypothetical protein